MEGYKRGSHTVWDCKYHVVWTTKYRFPVLGGDVGDRCRELIRETARAHEMIIHAGAINREPRAYASVDSSEFVGVTSGAVSEGTEFPQVAERVRGTAQALLGPALTGKRILGRQQRQRYR